MKYSINYHNTKNSRAEKIHIFDPRNSHAQAKVQRFRPKKEPKEKLNDNFQFIVPWQLP
ncbi:MAG TPA: hypothetical protein VFD91_08325 [Mariniphaga sp.]|nr:hypothetical protein [Mariniphaga sp.]